MPDSKITILTEQIEDEFLPFVRRPSRYIGGEINQIKKDISRCELSVALCFPELYEIGISNTGLSIIYDRLNRLDYVAAERVYAPADDAEKILREKKIPLFTLESKAALGDFDVIGFSLPYELCYTNMLNILSLAGIPLRCDQRVEEHPIIIAGGEMAYCCEPVTPFIDIFVLGEADEAVVQLAELIRAERKNHSTKQDILAKVDDKFWWAYVSHLYEVEYAGGQTQCIKHKRTGRQKQLQAVFLKDFGNAEVPTRQIVPFAQSVHERVSIEIMRGCPHRCRFCQASFLRRPLRFRDKEKIVEAAKKAYHETGFDTVSLLSLSCADYRELEDLIRELQRYFKDQHVGISLPSLRVGEQLKLVPDLVTSVRKAGLTIAVEAASTELRDVINKPLANEDLFAAVEQAYKAGWEKLKLYFMVGLPGETQKDITEIVNLCYQLSLVRKKIKGRPGQINITISWFVPKPHTPFGYISQKPREYFYNARQLILSRKKELRANGLHFKFHHIDRAAVEGAVARGGRRLADVIELAWQNGARFDLWDKSFNFDIWEKAFEECGMDVNESAQRQFGIGETSPWEHLSGPDKDYLLSHFRDSVELIKVNNSAQ